MRVIEVQLEDGRTFDIQVDNNASQREIEADIEMLKARTQAPTDVTEDMSTLDRFRAGLGRGMVNVGRQLGNIVGLVEDEELAQAGQLDAPLMQTGAGQAGSFVGELASTAPLAGGLVGMAGKGLGAAIPALRTTAAARPITTGAATGATEGAVEGSMLAGPESRAGGAMLGALGGTVGGAALPFLAKGFRGESPVSQTLAEVGVDSLTPGQMVPSGAWNQIEEAATSWPIVGASVTAAREKPKVQFAQQMIQQGRPPGADPVSVGDPGDMLSSVYQQFKPAYDQFKGFDVTPDAVSSLENNFLDAAFSNRSAIDKDVRDNIFDYLTNKLSGLENRQVKTDDLLKIRSDIRSQIVRKKQAQQWDHAELLEDAESSMSGIINAALPDDKRALMPKVDQQYAKHKIAEDALYRAGDRETPTPFQWQQAVKKATASKGAYARGAGLMREPVKAAKEAFGVVSPATGQRIATLGALGALGAGGAGMVGMNDPMAAAYIGMPLALLAGSRGGRQFSVGNMPSQAMLRQMLQNTTVPAALARGAIPVESTGE